MERRGLAVIEALLQREKRPYSRIGVRQLSPLIGAEIEGLDLRFPLSDEEVAEINSAFLEHHVLVFRDQHVSDEDHRRLITLLGAEAQPQRWPITWAPETTEDDAGEPVMLGDSWCADETYRARPPAGAAMHVHRLPRAGLGGDMMFANMHLAHELLADPLKKLLQDLTAIHRRNATGPLSSENESAEHPVVVRHPVTGRPAIFVNRRHTSHIVQLDPAQSESTLDMLFRHLESNPVLTCRIRWTANTLVVWDNRSTQHLTLQDFRPRCLDGHLALMVGRTPVRFQAVEA